MIRIPYGRKYRVTVSGSIWKPITCENCGCKYAYRVTYQTSSSATDLLWLNKEGTIRNAETIANQDLKNYLENAVRDYFCPDCGCYQSNAIQRKKNNILQRALIFGLITFIVMPFIIVASVAASSPFIFAYSFAIAAIVSIVLLSPLRNFNPNAKAHLRINQAFSESYPVIKKEELQPTLADSTIKKLKPFISELMQRVNAGEDMKAVIKSIAQRAGVSPDQVGAFALALARTLKEKDS